VQQRGIGLVGKLPEDLALVLVGVAQQAQRLVGVAGQDDLVVVRTVTGLVGHLHAAAVAVAVAAGAARQRRRA
jgi:hypothetical protein